MVLQDTWLFNGTIEENLKYGDTSATTEKIKEIAKSAYIDYFINSLPNGFKTEI
jgi:ABC-type multidrug transport system fused ATPase/permease subunit